MVRAMLTLAVVAVIAVIAAILFGFIDVSQTRTAELPHISVEGGQAPAFAVKTADVSVGTKATTVNVPEVDVGTKTKTVDVPSIDVKKPQ